MILTIDIGNTNIVFGVAEQNEWIKIWRIQTDRSKTADEYEVIFRSLFASSSINSSNINRTVLSSVVPSLVRPFREMLNVLLGSPIMLVEPQIYGNLPIEVLNPTKLEPTLLLMPLLHS